MSFDLSLNKGDLKIGKDGDLDKVRNTSKLIQDVLKILHIPLGSNPFYLRLGNSLTTENIGTYINQQFAEAKAAASITNSIQTLQSIQSNQELTQIVTPEEKIQDLAEVIVEQNQQDPRQYDIKVTVITETGSSVVLPSFSLSTIIGGEG